MTTELVQQIIFGAQGDDANHLGDGWSAAEPGYRWAVGQRSEIWLENPGPGDEFLLELELTPFCRPPTLPSQRLAVQVRNEVIGRSVVEVGGKLGYRVPAEVLAGRGPVRVILHHEDATAPIEFGANDRRVLAFSVRRLSLYRVSGDITQIKLEGGKGMSIAEMEQATGTPASQFMLKFESLGDNCEFGLVQRRCDAEPLSLLRFTNFPFEHLMYGLQTGFDGVGELARLEFWLTEGPKPEYVVRDKTLSLIFHTFQYAGEVDEARLLARQSARLQFLQRKLLEDLGNGEKIFVCKRNKPVADQEIMALHAALSRYARNTLLWVAPADTQHTPGSVERLMPGLLKGYIDRFAPYENAHDLSFEVWLEICANATRLLQQSPQHPGLADAGVVPPAETMPLAIVSTSEAQSASGAAA